jgi:hypothetical protein
VLQKVEKCEESFCTREREELPNRAAKNFGREQEHKQPQHKSVLKMGELDILCFFCQFAA